jgi:uncharacterized repeat protein (TIGR03803 family)
MDDFVNTVGNLHPIFRFQDGRNSCHESHAIRDGTFMTAAGDSRCFFNHPAAMHDAGIFFRLTPAGVFTTLYSFTGGADGSLPNAIAQGADGNFYGSTLCGPESPANVFTGFGKVFKITPAGALTTLYTFTGGNDGGNPSNVIQGGDGNLYGITSYPTIASVFKVTPAGVRNTIFRFEGNNGSGPSQLIASSDGNVYGTTQDGGIPQAGVSSDQSCRQITAYMFDGTGTGVVRAKFSRAKSTIYTE